VERLAKRDRDQTGFQTVTLNRNGNDLFACKWLRAPATTNDKGFREVLRSLAVFDYWLSDKL
jgi:hypothetical protein